MTGIYTQTPLLSAEFHLLLKSACLYKTMKMIQAAEVCKGAAMKAFSAPAWSIQLLF